MQRHTEYDDKDDYDCNQTVEKKRERERISIDLYTYKKRKVININYLDDEDEYARRREWNFRFIVDYWSMF